MADMLERAPFLEGAASERPDANPRRSRHVGRLCESFNLLGFKVLGDGPGMSHEAVAIDLTDGHFVRTDESTGAQCHGVQHTLQISRRGRDDPQHLGRRGLLLDERGATLTKGSVVRPSCVTNVSALPAASDPP